MADFNSNIKKFLPYLEDLRHKLFWSAIIFLITFVGGFFSSIFVLKKFVHFFKITGVVIATTSPFQLADLAVSIGFFFAILITLPIVLYQVFSFIFPALDKKEKGLFLKAVPISIFLFIFGFIYGFFLLYYSFNLLAKINSSLGIENIWDVGSFISQIFLTSSLLGVVFEFPIILTLLIKMKLLDVSFLKKKRRIAFFMVFIMVALLPPTDGLSLIAMGLPLILLYEATILININKKYVWTRN